MSRSIRLLPFAVAIASFSGLACDPPTKPTPFAVTQIAPSVGTREGGTEVLIYGTGFKDPVSVYFGDQPAKVGSVGTRSVGLSVTSPPAPPGQVDVRVVNGTGEEVILRGAFSYTDFTITGLTPALLLPYESLKIQGTGIPIGTEVVIGPVPVETYPGSSGVSLLVSVPPLPPGPYDVKVITPRGTTVTLSDVFKVRGVSVTVSSLAPAPGGALTVSWSGGHPDVGRFDDPLDYIGLFRVGDSNDSPIWRQDVLLSSGSYNVNAPMQPGDYEFRFLIYYVPHVYGRSEMISVPGSTPSRR